jgi:transposase-like protein
MSEFEHDWEDDTPQGAAGNLPVARSMAEQGEVLPVQPSMRDMAEELVRRAREEGVELTGQGGLVNELVRQVMQTGLEVEMEEHLGYGRGDRSRPRGPNKRNGTTPKTVTTEVGQVRLDVPRDRDGSFEPQTVPKHARRLEGVTTLVIDLYGRGMTQGEVKEHLLEIYGTDVSKDTISRMTDQIVDDMKAWQSRPIDPVYPVLIIDAVVIKVRDSQVANRPVYVAMGINMEGDREVLGLWIGPSGGEGAKHWITMLTELKNRGLQDALIVCCDGLKGLPDAIRMTWPNADVQTCVVHLVRAGLKYAGRKDWKQIAGEMRRIYTAPTVEGAEALFAAFEEQWGGVYPAMIRTWQNAWSDFVPFLGYPPEIRKLVYTTNAIESLNARFRRATRHRGHFPTEQAALKVLYLIATRNRANRQDLQGRVSNWREMLNILYVHYGDRIDAVQ